MFRFLALVLMFTAAPATALAGGGGTTDAGTCPGFAEGSIVSMRDGCFTGVAHFAPNDTLTIRNDGLAPHTYTAVDGSFDTGVLASGETVELTGLATGVYRVYCTLHATPKGDGMTGVLVIGVPTEPGSAQIEVFEGSIPGAETAGLSGESVGVIGLAVAAGAGAGWFVAGNRFTRRRDDATPPTRH